MGGGIIGGAIKWELQRWSLRLTSFVILGSDTDGLNSEGLRAIVSTALPFDSVYAASLVSSFLLNSLEFCRRKKPFSFDSVIRYTGRYLATK